MLCGPRVLLNQFVADLVGEDVAPSMLVFIEQRPVKPGNVLVVGLVAELPLLKPVIKESSLVAMFNLKLLQDQESLLMDLVLLLSRLIVFLTVAVKRGR